MRFHFRFMLTVAAAALFGYSAAAQAETLIAVSQSTSLRAIHADVIVLGRVIEIEKDTVEGPAYANAPKDLRITYKVAILKIDDPLIGARGLTQLRVGFPADAPATIAPPADGGPGVAVVGLRGGGRVRPGHSAVALTAGMEGCFLLDPFAGSDFYVQSGNGPPLTKKDENYEKELKAVQAVVKAIDDPVSALKSKELDDRFRAAHAVLQRYQTARGNPGRVSREPIPAEESKLLLAVVAELPWLPKDGAPRPAGDFAPSRSALWYTVNWAEQGFKQPANAPGVDFNKVMDDATTAFLKANAEKIKLKRAVAR